MLFMILSRNGTSVEGVTEFAMRIGSTSASSFPASRLDAAARRSVASGSGVVEGEVARTRAIVPVAPIARARDDETRRIVRHRVDAAFLAQLVATAEDLPETRRLRRIEARQGAEAYARTGRPESLLTPGYLVDVAR